MCGWRVTRGDSAVATVALNDLIAGKRFRRRDCLASRLADSRSQGGSSTSGPCDRVGRPPRPDDEVPRQFDTVNVVVGVKPGNLKYLSRIVRAGGMCCSVEDCFQVPGTLKFSPGFPTSVGDRPTSGIRHTARIFRYLAPV